MINANTQTNANTLKMQTTAAMPRVRPFLSRSQLAAMAEGCRGEEKEFFMTMFVSLSERIAGMPKTYEQDGLGLQAVVHLHYFLGGRTGTSPKRILKGVCSRPLGMPS